MRIEILALALLLAAPATAGAEWQLKPFLGVSFGGGTTFADPEQAVGEPNISLGFTGALLGDIFGVEADFGYTPGVFQSGDFPVLNPGTDLDERGSRVTTLTGNFVVALARQLAQYTLRPYVVAGLGVMHVKNREVSGGLTFARTLPVFDVGGGATGFLSDRVGLNWDLRYFRSFGGDEPLGVAFDSERLSFWRASMALAIRY